MKHALLIILIASLVIGTAVANQNVFGGMGITIGKPQLYTEDTVVITHSGATAILIDPYQADPATKATDDYLMSVLTYTLPLPFKSISEPYRPPLNTGAQQDLDMQEQV
jgi:hypothetical protein